MDIDYEDFLWMELAVAEKGRKYSARDFVVNLLEERPYSKTEIKDLAADAGLIFDHSADATLQVRNALNDLIEEGVVEKRFDKRGRIYYGLTKKANPE